MTKRRHWNFDSYTIRGTNQVVKAGDCVLMRPSDNNSEPYVACVEEIESKSLNDVNVKVRWYYRPEETVAGRKPFHGAKELLLSDHYDVQSADTIEEKCTIHTFKNYTMLANARPQDYYYRFEYKTASGDILPDLVVVYCKCEQPYNPDKLMIQCDECNEWYHPACEDMTIEQAMELNHFVCSNHLSGDDVKKPHKTLQKNRKAKTKRRKK